MRFVAPLIFGNLERIASVVGCATWINLNNEKLKAERPEKGLNSFSVRTAPKPTLTAGSPSSSPLGDVKIPSPCAVNKQLSSCGNGGGSKLGNPCGKDKNVGADFEPRSPVQDQLNEFKKGKTATTYLTTSSGAFVGSKTASMTVGQRGAMMLQDFVFMDEIAHFNRERIPERVVNAKGAGAFGQFEVTNDITKYCKAGIFKMGKKTPVAVRFSNLTGESGSSDTVRDLYGFSVKFYTEEGNWDIVGSNLPAFFIRDPIHFPSLAHSQKRNPVTHIRDADMFWDFIANRPETTHALLLMYSDRGIPDGYRHMNGYGNHTFKMVNKDGCVYYCKFHFKTNQGVINLSPEESQCIAGHDPDYNIRDLYNAIGRKECPYWTFFFFFLEHPQTSTCIFLKKLAVICRPQVSPYSPCWTFFAQIISEDDARCAKDWNPFDPTKIWPHSMAPLVPIGKLGLNRNPKNYLEQLAFSPAHLVPGIEPSPDKVLQGRLFAYSDTQRYRLGVNYHQLPVNCPLKTKVANYQRDGQMRMECNQDGAPNYYPNYFNGPPDSCKYLETPTCMYGEVARYETVDEDNYSQAAIFYQMVLNSLNFDHRNALGQAKRRDLVDQCQRQIDKCSDMSAAIFHKLAQAHYLSNVGKIYSYDFRLPPARTGQWTKQQL